MVRTSLLSVKLWGKKVCASFSVIPPSVKVAATVCGKPLLSWERHSLVEGSHKQKVCSNQWQPVAQKALSLYEDFSKGSPEASDMKPFPTTMGWSPDSGIGLD